MILKFSEKKAKLHGFEFPKKVHLTEDAFTIENGILTPTMKVKRHEAKLRFIDIINKLYSETNAKL